MISTLVVYVKILIFKNVIMLGTKNVNQSVKINLMATINSKKAIKETKTHKLPLK